MGRKLILSAGNHSLNLHLYFNLIVYNLSCLRYDSLQVFFDNLIVSCAGGLVCGKILPKHYREYKKRKQINELRTQFKDLLESLTSSYSAGQKSLRHRQSGNPSSTENPFQNDYKLRLSGINEVI